MILPETEVRLDGRPVITYTYSMFSRKPSALKGDADPSLLVNKKNNPDYLGHIDFEEPGKVFNYIADGEQELSRDEVEEIIEETDRYRHMPQR